MCTIIRKVKFNKWIKIEYIYPEGGTRTKNPETGCYEKGFPNEGVFHHWGVSHEEFESGPGNFTVAIIETPDGLIHEVIPGQMKFDN
jgi:hypothetical protein